MDDVELGIGLDKATGRGADGRAHVGNEEATIWLCADLICDGGEKGAVGLLELGLVGVRGVEVEGSVLYFREWMLLKRLRNTHLRLQEGEQTPADKGLPIKRRTEMVRRVATRRHISDGDQRSEGVIVKRVSGKEVLVLVVTSCGPEIPNLLGAKLGVDRVRWAVKRRSWDLQDRQGRRIVGKRLSDA